MHCSIRKGLLKALEEAAALQCQTMQIFTRSPRGWWRTKLSKEEIENFTNQRKKADIYPLIVHSPYLPNLATSDIQLYRHSKAILKEDLVTANRLEAGFLVIHPGSYSLGGQLADGIKRAADAINWVFSKIVNPVMILLENLAGGGRRIASSFQELKEIISLIEQKERVGLCLDTCHAVGAGYDLTSTEGVLSCLEEIDKNVGLNKLKVIHLNDSKSPLNSHLDRHEHLGKGHIGKKNLAFLLHQPSLEDCAIILETPKDSPSADKNNLTFLRRIIRGRS